MKNNIIKVSVITIAVVGCLCLLWLLCYNIDISRAKDNKLPIFCIKKQNVENALVEYRGIGYKIYSNSETENITNADLLLGKKISFGDEFKNEIFEAIVTDVNQKNIIVMPINEKDKAKLGDKVSISLPIDSINNYVVGEKVKITYNGLVKETYPVQIVAIDIYKISIDKIALMYEKLLEHIINEDNALNYDAKYIAIDLNSFKRPVKTNEVFNMENNQKYPALEETTKNILINYCKKYNTDVKVASFNDLKSQGLFNEEQIYIEGILIYINEIKELTENKAVISATKYRSGNGAIFPEYELTYVNNKWEIKVLSMAIS